MSILHQKSITELKTTLLGNDEDARTNLLEELQATRDLSVMESLHKPLLLLACLHTDESVRNASAACLPRQEELAEAKLDLAIFQSIAEYYPWMGDYTGLQEENFARFEQNKAKYLPELATSPLLVEAYLDLGRKLYMLFELIEQAQSCFETILIHNQQHAEVYYALGRIFERKRRYQQALAHYEKCINLDPENRYGLMQLGTLKVQQFEEYEEGIRYYNKVIEMDPYAAEVYVRIAEAYYAQEDIERTQQFIDIALVINEFNEEALNLLGRLQWQVKGNFEKAMATFKKGLDHQMHGDSGLLLGSLAELQMVYLNDYKKARLYYEKALKAKPKQPNRVRELIALLDEFYQDQAAIDATYQQYLKAEANDPEMFADYAEFLMTYLHAYEAAAEQLEKALALNENHSKAQALHTQLKGLLPNDEDDEFGDEDDDDDFVGGGAPDSDTGPVSDQ